MKLRLKIIKESLNEGANITSSDFATSETLFGMHEVTKLFKIQSDDMEMTQELKFEHSLEEGISKAQIAALEKCGRGDQVTKDEYGLDSMPAFDISFDIVELVVGGKKISTEEYSSDVFPNRMIAITFLRNIVKAIADFASQNDNACFVFSGVAQDSENKWETTKRTKVYSMMLQRAFKKSSGWVIAGYGPDDPNDFIFFRCNNDNGTSSLDEMYSLIDEECSSIK